MKRRQKETLTLVATVGSFALLLGNQLFSCYSTPLQGVAGFSATSLPPSVVEAVAFQARLSDDFDKKLRNLPTKFSYYSTAHADLVAVSRQWNIAVTNAGKQKLSGVRILARNAVEARVERDGGMKSDTTTNGVVLLGDFAPRESAVVTIWLDGSSLDFTTSDEPQLSHDTGVGDILIRRSVGEFGQRAETFGLPLMWVAFSVLLSYVLVHLISSWGEAAGRRQVREEEKAKAEAAKAKEAS